LPKKTTKTGKRSSVLEGKSSEFQEIPPLNPDQFKHFHHTVTLGAFRYALGRRSYLVAEIVEWLINFWDEIPPGTKEIIILETEDAVMLSSCGDECDLNEWERLLDFAHKKSRFL
jgi:hypothetical protein